MRNFTGKPNYLPHYQLLYVCSPYILGSIWPEKRYLPLPFGITSLFCSALYMTSWQFDPCSHYRVEKSKSHERKNQEIVTKKAITLARKSKLKVNSLNNFLTMHSIIALSSFGFCYWKVSSYPSCQPDKAVVGIAGDFCSKFS